MYASGRFSYGLTSPRYKAIVSAAAGIGVAVALSGAATIKHAAHADASLSIDVGAIGTRAVRGASDVSIETNAYGTPGAIRAASSNVYVDATLSGHSFNYLTGEALVTVNVNMYGIGAQVLGSGNINTGASLQGAALKKSFRTTAVQVSVNAVQSGGNYIIRGGFALPRVELTAKAGAKLKKTGESFWRHSGKALPGISTNLNATNSLIILKALGGKITTANIEVTGKAHKITHETSRLDVDVGLSAWAYNRQWADSHVLQSTDIQVNGRRVRFGYANPETSVAAEGRGNQTVNSAVNVYGGVTLSPPKANLSHAARTNIDLGVGVSSFGTKKQLAVANPVVEFVLFGKGVKVLHAQSSVAVNIDMTGFAYGNIGVPAPEWRTAVLPEENRDMNIPSENRTMELT